jgi:hypothetical protein
MTLFPRPLVTCIAEGRLPSLHELVAMTDRVWREVYRATGHDDSYRRSASIARLALLGAPVD